MENKMSTCSPQGLRLVAISFFAFCLVPVAFFAGCKNKESAVSESDRKQQQWTCSMHPEIIRDKPGNCPICGMTLVKKDEITIAVNAVQVNDLLRPTDRFVISSIPVTTINKESLSIETEALGTIAYDTRLISTISARVSGRIEKLYIKYRYQHVMKGQPIMDIYSPQLLTAQQEFLFLTKNDPNNFSLINAARQKLLLLGMSEAQLQRIEGTGKPSLTVTVYSNYTGHVHEAGNAMPGENTEGKGTNILMTTEQLPIKEGAYVEKGQNIFQVYNVDRSWVLLNIFPEYQGVIKVNDAVRVVPETAPDKDFRAKIDFIEPFFRTESKTLIARAYFDNSKLDIPVGSQVKTTIFTSNNEADWLPKDAVLSLGIDKIVFLKTDGGFRAHKVQTGLSYKSQIQILAGLTRTDSVASNAQFLADSESFIKANE